MMKPTLIFLFFSSLFFVSDHAYAILGKKSTIRQMQRIGSRPGHTNHEQATVTATLTEHARSDGIVYGISWKGIAPPDVMPLLGDYADEYKKINQQASKKLGKRARRMGSSKLVVEYWGHMRNLRGRIYDPRLLVDGVRPSEIE